jgi:hypothetical protein
METGLVVVTNEINPLRADDDWPFAAETMAGRPIDDLVRHPAIDEHPFGPRLDGSWSCLLNGG